MYHLDKKQIQEITDYIFLEDRLDRVGIQRYTEVSRVFQKKGRNTEQILPVRRTF